MAMDKLLANPLENFRRVRKGGRKGGREGSSGRGEG